MLDIVLRLIGVNTHIGDYHVLQGVDLEAPRRGVSALLGRNGAGKTTTLRSIMGLWKAQGTIEFDGLSLVREPTFKIARLGVGYVPESLGLFNGLTVHENLVLAARSGSIKASRLEWIHSLFPALNDLRDRRAGNLSGGQKQMLAIAKAIIEPKRLILVDEPTKGLAPSVVEQLILAFRRLSEEETAILLVEQNFHFAKAIAATATVLESGRTAWRGKMLELESNDALQQKLLGVSLG